MGVFENLMSAANVATSPDKNSNSGGNVSNSGSPQKNNNRENVFNALLSAANKATNPLDVHSVNSPNQSVTHTTVQHKQSFSGAGKTTSINRQQQKNQQLDFQNQLNNINLSYRDDRGGSSKQNAMATFSQTLEQNGFTIKNGRVVPKDKVQYKEDKKVLHDKNMGFAAVDAARNAVEQAENVGSFTFGKDGSLIATDDKGNKVNISTKAPEDVTDYSAINERKTEYERSQDLAKLFDKKSHLLTDAPQEDTFKGQSRANFNVGSISEESNRAWSEYVKNPTEANRQYAMQVDSLLQGYSQRNNVALDDKNVKAGILSKEFAQYLPQLGNQMKAQAVGGAVGAGLGFLGGGGVQFGFKAGASVGSGIQSYNSMLGAAYKGLDEVAPEISNDVKLANAKNEAVISSVIEMGDTFLDLSTLAGKDIALALGKSVGNEVIKETSRKLPQLLAAYGFNSIQEAGEEGLQEAVSIANENLTLQGKTATPLELIEEALKVLVSAGKDVLNNGLGGDNLSDNTSRLGEAAKGGFDIALVSGGGRLGATQAINTIRNNSTFQGGKSGAQALVDEANWLTTDGLGSNGIADIRNALPDAEQALESGKRIKNKDMADLLVAVATEKGRRGENPIDLAMKLSGKDVQSAQESASMPSDPKAMTDAQLDQAIAREFNVATNSKRLAELQAERNRRLSAQNAEEAIQKPVEASQAQTNEIIPDNQQESVQAPSRELNSQENVDEAGEQQTEEDSANEQVEAPVQQNKQERSFKEILEQQRKNELKIEQSRSEEAKKQKAEYDAAIQNARYTQGSNDYSNMTMKELVDALTEQTRLASSGRLDANIEINKIRSAMTALSAKNKGMTIKPAPVSTEERIASLDDQSQRLISDLQDDFQLRDRYINGTGEFVDTPIEERLENLSLAFPKSEFFISDGKIVQANMSLSDEDSSFDENKSANNLLGEDYDDNRDRRQHRKDVNDYGRKRSSREEPPPGVGTRITNEMLGAEEAERKETREAYQKDLKEREQKRTISPESINNYSRAEKLNVVSELLKSGATRQEIVKQTGMFVNENGDVFGASSGAKVGHIELSRFEGGITNDASSSEFNSERGNRKNAGDNALSRGEGGDGQLGLPFSGNDNSEKNQTTGRSRTFEQDKQIIESVIKSISPNTPVNVIESGGLSARAYARFNKIFKEITFELKRFYSEAHKSYQNPSVEGVAAHEGLHAAIDEALDAGRLTENDLMMSVEGCLSSVYNVVEAREIVSYYAVASAVEYGDRSTLRNTYEELCCNLAAGNRLIGTPFMDSRYEHAALEMRNILIDGRVVSNNAFDNVPLNLDAFYSNQISSSNGFSDLYGEHETEWISSADYEQEQRRQRRAEQEAQEKEERDDEFYNRQAQETFGTSLKGIQKNADDVITSISGFYSDKSVADNLPSGAVDKVLSFTDALRDVTSGKMSLSDFAYIYTRIGDDVRRGNAAMADFYNESTNDLINDMVEYHEKAVKYGWSSDWGNFRATARDAFAKIADDVKKGQQAINDKKTVSADVSSNSKFFLGKNGNPKILETLYNVWTKRPSTMFKFLGAWQKGKDNVMYQYGDAVDRSARQEISMNTNVQLIAQKVTTKPEYSDFFNGKMKSGVEYNGKSVSMADAVSFMLTFDTLGGVNSTRVQDLDGFYLNGDKITLAKESAKELNQLYDDIKSAINGNETARQFVETVREISEYLAPFLKEAGLRINGFEPSMMSNGKYFPIIYGNDSLDFQSKNTKELVDFKRVKERTRKVGGYLDIRNAAEVFSAYANSSVNYCSWGELSQRLSLANRESAIGNTISATARQVGNDYGNWINDYITRISNTADFNEKNGAMNGLNKALAEVRQKWTTGTLALSPTVPIKQVSSFWSAAGVLDMDVLARVRPGTRKIFGKAANGKEDIILQSRKTGNIDPDLMSGRSTLAKAKAQSKLLNTLANMTSIMDYTTLDNLYDATYLQVKKNNPNLDENSTEFQQKLEDLYAEVTIKTQPIFSRKARAEMLATDKEFVRLFTNFKTQQTQNLNNIAETVGEYRAAKQEGDASVEKKKLKQTIAGQATSYVSFAILSTLADLAMHAKNKYGKDDDEEDEEKSFYGNIDIEKLLLNVGGTLVSTAAGTTPFGDDIADFIYGQATKGKVNNYYGISLGWINTLKQTVDAIGSAMTAFQNDKLSPKEVYNVIRYSSQMAGIPVHNVYRTANAFAMAAREVFGDEKPEYDMLIDEWDAAISAEQNLKINNAEKIAAADKAGLSYDDWRVVYDKYHELDDDSSLKQGQKADRFKVWLENGDYTDEQVNLMTDQFKYWTHVSASTDIIDRYLGLGLTPDNALAARNALSDAEAAVREFNSALDADDPNKKSYSGWNKVDTLLGLKLSDEDVDSLATDVLSEKQLSVYDALRQRDLSPSETVALWLDADANHNGYFAKDEVKALKKQYGKSYYDIIDSMYKAAKSK